MHWSACIREQGILRTRREWNHRVDFELDLESVTDFATRPSLLSRAKGLSRASRSIAPSALFCQTDYASRLSVIRAGCRLRIPRKNAERARPSRRAQPSGRPYALTNRLKFANREQATCVSRINRSRLFLSGKSSTITKISSKNCARTGANVAIAVRARS